MRGGRQVLEFNRQSSGWLFGAALVNTAAILSVFFAPNVGNVVRVEPLIASNPLLSLLWTGIFLKELERVLARIVGGALVTVTGTVLVATVK
jgi:uncharacterized membrane protein